MARKEAAEITKQREALTRTLAKLDAAESKMLRAVNKWDGLRKLKKRVERRLAMALAGPIANS